VSFQRPKRQAQTQTFCATFNLLHCWTHPYRQPQASMSSTSSSKVNDVSVQTYWGLLLEMDRLNLQTSIHIQYLATHEAIVKKRQNPRNILHLGKSRRPQDSHSRKEKEFSDYKMLMSRHLKNIKALQASYRQQILGMLKGDETVKLEDRRRVMLAAHHAAKDIHVLFLRASRNIFLSDVATGLLFTGSYRNKLRISVRRPVSSRHDKDCPKTRTMAIVPCRRLERLAS
jgi:hypothetical protein